MRQVSTSCRLDEIYLFKEGQTALEIATAVGKLEIVKVLLERGANVNVKRDKSFFGPNNNPFQGSFFSPSWLHYRSALQIAVDKGFEEIAKVLLDSGAIPLPIRRASGDDIGVKRQSCIDCSSFAQTDFRCP
jgi:ankyrin repeat protein